MKFSLKQYVATGLICFISLLQLSISERVNALEDYDPSYPNLIDGYVLARLDRLGIEPHWASQSELMRRMSLDLTGMLPDDQDAVNLAAATPAEMVQYFMNKPEYRTISQTIFADLLLFSNDQMFSTDTQLDALNDLVGRLHDGVIMYDEFARQAITDQAFLSRFVSSADRATASLIIFLGYEPVTPYDFQFAKMFNGYRLTDADAREYTWTGECDNPATPNRESCYVFMWDMVGQNPTDAGMMLTSLPAFAEHGAMLLWRRYIGSDIDVILPELAVALGENYETNGFNLREMTLLILTSAAYRQSYTYRQDDLVL